MEDKQAQALFGEEYAPCARLDGRCVGKVADVRVLVWVHSGRFFCGHLALVLARRVEKSDTRMPDVFQASVSYSHNPPLAVLPSSPTACPQATQQDDVR